MSGFDLGWSGTTSARALSPNASRNYSCEGMERYGSRTTVPRIEIGGEPYALTVLPKVVDQDDTLDFDVYRFKDSEYARSHNFGVIDGRIAYNEGHYLAEASEDKRSDPAAFARAATDDRFRYTSAQEFGHTVPSESGGKYFSLTHKGSTGLDQKTHDASPSFPPSPDEIDLMFYYSDGAPFDFYQRVRASNDDILRLLSTGAAKLT